MWEAIGSRPDPLAAFRALDPKTARFRPRREAALRPFRSLLARLDSPSLRSSPSEAIRSVVEEVYRDFARAKFPNGDARLDDLEQFAQFAQTYESLPGFLEEVTLFNELSGEDVVAGEPDDDRVVLSSVHQAKGLEWSRVIVMGLSEGRFPNYRSVATDEGLEEERRLFYVAVTRAKNEVALGLPDAGAGPLRRGRHPGALPVRDGAARRGVRALDGGARGRVRRGGPRGRRTNRSIRSKPCVK